MGPLGAFGNRACFLVLQRARQAFLSFAFPFFQASGDNGTKPFSESQEHPKRTCSLALVLLFLPLQIEYVFLVFDLPAQLFFTGKIKLVD